MADFISVYLRYSLKTVRPRNQHREESPLKPATCCAVLASYTGSLKLWFLISCDSVLAGRGGEKASIAVPLGNAISDSWRVNCSNTQCILPEISPCSKDIRPKKEHTSLRFSGIISKRIMRVKTEPENWNPHFVGSSLLHLFQLVYYGAYLRWLPKRNFR